MKNNETWEEAILSAIIKLGSQNIALQDIFAEMENHPLVTQRHKEAWKSGKQLRYITWINSCIPKMIKKGMIKRVARAVYSVID